MLGLQIKGIKNLSCECTNVSNKRIEKALACTNICQFSCMSSNSCMMYICVYVCVFLHIYQLLDNDYLLDKKGQETQKHAWR